ncbi:unnamed protein product [Urochloa decumbens]|uniref:FHA domain-containing protein n=1 Tax=Urochloa decumbens TaxID=240449 RepID=A0ABC9G4B2_9POAL
MAAPNSPVASVDSGYMLPAFAKLHGEDFVYFMRKYSIILGRSTETCKVDLDLSELGGGRGPRVSRHHARIFYDFELRHFALEVIGKNGCSIRDVSYLPGNVPIKLNSQDLIEIAGKKFYFLLATRPFSATLAAHASLLPQPTPLILPNPAGEHGDVISAAHGTDTEDQQLLEEERDVVSSIALLISDICSPGEWVTMEALHSELVERLGNSWSSARVRRYLRNDSVSSTGTEDRPWCRLLLLLRRHPEHFVMSTVTRGEVTSEYAALVSSLSLGNEP